MRDQELDVSVVIPTYNRSRLIAQAVRSALENDLRDHLEVIVVDDSSSDETPSMLADFSQMIKVIHHAKNLGGGAARNTGLEAARGRWVKFLDSDDLLEGRSLTREVEIGDASGAEIVVSGWGTVKVDEAGAEIPGTRAEHSAPFMEPLPEAILEGKASPTSAVLYRRSHLGGLCWSSEIQQPDDWHFFVQAALRATAIATHPGIAYWWRSHPGDRVTDEGSMLDYAHAHHKILDMMWKFLQDSHTLNPRRQSMLAQYYYKQIYVLALYDPSGFETAVTKIMRLDPTFRPTAFERRRTMKGLARLVGFRRAILLFTRTKSLLRHSVGG